MIYFDVLLRQYLEENTEQVLISPESHQNYSTSFSSYETEIHVPLSMCIE